MATERNGGTARVATVRAPRRPPGPTVAGTEMGAAAPIWSSIPRDLAVRLRPMTGVMVQDAIREIQRNVPAYDQPLRGKFREVLVGAVEMAITKCFDDICDPDTEQTDWKAVFRYSGKVEFMEGRTMDSLQTAVRIGARVAWRHISVMGRRMGVPTDLLFTVADAIFAWVDELSTVAIEGYTEAQAHASGALERRRKQLLKLILAEPPAGRQQLVDLAATTDWTMPDRVAVVALEYFDDQHHRPAVSLGRDVLVDLESGEPCLVVADPHRYLGRLEEALHGQRAAVGPLVPLAQARRSLAVARRALGFVQRGVLPDVAVTWCDEHLSTLALLSDEFLIAQLTQRTMAPFEGLRVKQRERLASTLLAWLETRGGVNEMAGRLDIHPQTVRYRMHQIEELLGDRLADPDERLTMEIALRARRLLDPCPAVQPVTEDDDEKPLRDAV
ncbi:MAG TPA: helix-turn-helix domain-containing protein [Actinophytocola sp.]|uniref:PucR family transcriptional regulator n=1 Tax=Actinophytocola sp. TaxID=1872138 RepID=UPI002DBC31D7|nr:helix-turn-helix domain-containing protein [Actinophytocola sp.]HEU5470509.1 helix-turn-helix domain-containing protein [Actinophytocola sp.]